MLNKLMFLLIGLALLNVVTHGYVYSQITQLVGSAETENIKRATICLTGIILLPPVIPIPFFGREIWLFVPALSDILAAAFFAMIILAALKLFSVKYTPLHAVLLCIGIWFSVKLFALFLVWISGPQCMSLLLYEQQTFMAAYAVGSVISPVLFAKFLFWKYARRGL